MGIEGNGITGGGGGKIGCEELEKEGGDNKGGSASWEVGEPEENSDGERLRRGRDSLSKDERSDETLAKRRPKENAALDCEDPA